MLDMRMDIDDFNDFVRDVEGHYNISLLAEYNKSFWQNGKGRPVTLDEFCDLVDRVCRDDSPRS